MVICLCKVWFERDSSLIVCKRFFPPVELLKREAATAKCFGVIGPERNRPYGETMSDVCREFGISRRLLFF